MAVLGRLLVSSAERLDLPDFLSIDSYTQGDFKYLLRSFVGGNKPYILTGFDVIDPNNALGTQNISIRVANSVAYYPGSLAGPFFHGLEEGNTLASPLVPELRKNSTNYVYLTLSTTEAAKDTRAFWDPDKEAGAGGEFTQDVNTQTALIASVNVSVSAFPENTIPVCKVVVGANFIVSIEDARNMMFRLGSGGLNPNPLSTYAFRNNPTSTYARSEPNTLMSNALDPNSFQGGDKNIQTLKEWMDVVMTKLLELSGTTYWYEDTASYSIVNVFKDALASSIKSKGLWQSSNVTAGLLTWTEDIILQSVADSRDVIIRAGNKTLLDNQVMYLDQNRGEEINTGAIAVNWFNATNYVNGSLGSFENLTKGDWIKKANDADNLYLRVEEFYANTNLAGGVTSAGNALSIKLSGTYAGISEAKQGIYVQGAYLSAAVNVADRNNTLLTAAGGDLYWLAMRSDTIMGVSGITTTQLNIDITDHDSVQAKCTLAAHGLVDKQKITIAGSTNFNGVFQVEVTDADTFYITLSGGPFANELAQTAFYATVTTAARSTADGYLLESANHNFELDQNVIISGTTNYNGNFDVFPLNNTTFSIPVSSLIANESTGIATSVNILVRTDLGPTKLSQGENKGIGEVESDNIMSFTGMDNASQTYPLYSISPTYNALSNYVNFNSDLTDNLTQRVSKLTAMMADKAQDKTIKLVSDHTTVANTTNGAAQEITMAGGSGTATVIMPSSSNNGTIGTGGTLSLNANQVAYYTVNRNASFSIANLGALTVANINSVVLGENTFIFAYRLAGTTVYLWNNQVLSTGTSIDLSVLRGYVQDNKTVKLIKGGTWSWNSGTNELISSASAYLQLAGLAENVNEISAQTISLTADGQCAYVTLKRTAGASVLTVSVAAIASVPKDDHTFIIARRVDNDVIVGTYSTRIQTQQKVSLDDPDYLVNDSRFKTVIPSTPGKTVNILPSKRISNGREIFSYIIPNISSKFPRTGYTTGTYDGGANHDQPVIVSFSDPVASVVTVTATGPTFGAQVLGTFTSSGTNRFTPISIFINPDDSLAFVAGSNYIDQVTASLDDNLPVGGDIQFKTAVIIHEVDVANITTQTILESDIIDRRAFGGAGGGSGEGSSVLGDLKDFHDETFYKYLEPNIFSIDEEDKLNTGSSTGSYSVVSKTYDLDPTESLQSYSLLDAEFLESLDDILKATVVLVFDRDNIDTTPVVELTPNGDIADLQTVTMERLSDDNDTYVGTLTFDLDALTPQTLHEKPYADADATAILNDVSTQQRSQEFTQTAYQVLETIGIQVRKTGTPTGYLKVNLHEDNAGNAGVIKSQSLVNITTLTAGLNTLTIDIGRHVLPNTGKFHISVETDADYKASYVAATHEVGVEVDSSAPSIPDSRVFDGTVWSAVVGSSFVYKLEGRAVDLIMKYTAGTAAKLKGYGVYYGEEALSTQRLKRRAQFVFHGTNDNLNSFSLPWDADPDFLEVVDIFTGQIFQAPAFELQGNEVVFPVDFFDGRETVHLIAKQVEGGSYDANPELLKLAQENHEGSVDPALDRSAAGRGKLYRASNTVLLEHSIQYDADLDEYYFRLETV